MKERTNLDCKQAALLMNDLLDDNMDRKSVRILKTHMLACKTCHERFRQLEQLDQLLYSFNHHIQPVSTDLVNRVMNVIPKSKQSSIFLFWFKRHWKISISIFFVLIIGIIISHIWDMDKQLIVKGRHLDGVIIKNNKVIVPANKVIVGDLTIYNGFVEIYGKVKGGVTIISGKLNQSSTAHITGSIQQINEGFSWVWYQIVNLIHVKRLFFN